MLRFPKSLTLYGDGPIVLGLLASSNRVLGYAPRMWGEKAMRGQYQLFSEIDLNDVLTDFRAQAVAIIKSIPQGQFLELSDPEIIDIVSSKVQVLPIEIDEGNIEMRFEDIEIDVRGDPRRFIPRSHIGPALVPGTMVIIDIPYTGSKEIFRGRTNPGHSNPPYATISDEHILLEIAVPDDLKEEERDAKCKIALKLLRECISFANSQVESFNSGWRETIRYEAERRREKLSANKHMAESMGAKVASDSRSSYQNHAISRNEKGKNTKGTLSSKIYEEILSLIRHQGHSFEATPRAYRNHTEEELRDIMLSQLNGSIKGKATSETFRNNGKTDICIKCKDGSAFIAECKIWNGRSSVESALDQLVGYTTWRDNSVALVIFNKNNKNFGKILDEMPKALIEHSLTQDVLRSEEDGEWRIVVCREGDIDRRIVVHVFAFDLFHEES